MDNIDCDDCNDYKPKVFSKPLQPVEKEPQDLIYLTDPNNIHCNETKTQMVCRLMDEILEEGGDDTVKNGWISMKAIIDNYESIDKEMVELLHTIFNDDLNRKDAYEEVVKSVEEGSIIVYFKSAQLFKIYKKDDIINLLDGQLRTNYKHIRESYEIIPKNSEQKLIIMGDISLLDKLDSIKEYIRKFMINKGINEFKAEDIICFKNSKTDMLEIVINNYYVNNSEERNIIVHDLLAYIVDMEKNNTLSRKLGPPSGYSDIKGVDIITMPSEKQLINENTNFIEMVDRLVRNTTNCSNLNRNGNTYIVNVIGVQNNAETINHTETTNIVVSEDDNNVNNFVTYIKDTEPEWYKEGKWIKKDILYNQYVSMYENMTKQKFAILFKDILYTLENRKMVNKSRHNFVKLFKFCNI